MYHYSDIDTPTKFRNVIKETISSAREEIVGRPPYEIHVHVGMWKAIAVEELYDEDLYIKPCLRSNGGVACFDIVNTRIVVNTHADMSEDDVLITIQGMG